MPILDQPSLRELSNQQIADRLGVQLNTVFRWHHGARLYPSTADRVALNLGLHPVNLWPEWELT